MSMGNVVKIKTLNLVNLITPLNTKNIECTLYYVECIKSGEKMKETSFIAIFFAVLCAENKIKSLLTLKNKVYKRSPALENTCDFCDWSLITILKVHFFLIELHMYPMLIMIV